MSELYHAAFSTVNIVPTFLLLLVLLYWLSVFIGVLDMDFLHFDVDADVDVDVDVDVHVDAHAEHDASFVGSASGLSQFLTFFNLGQVPFMVFMSFFIFPLWSISILANYYLGNQSFLISLLLLIPGLIISLFVTKFLTWPFAKVYRKMSAEEHSLDDLTGQIITVLLPATEARLGQGEVNIDGHSFRMNIKATKDNSLEKGKAGLLIEFIQDKNYYLVEPYDNH